jgi:hypothetical protein
MVVPAATEDDPSKATKKKKEGPTIISIGDHTCIGYIHVDITSEEAE